MLTITWQETVAIQKAMEMYKAAVIQFDERLDGAYVEDMYDMVDSVQETCKSLLAAMMMDKTELTIKLEQ